MTITRARPGFTVKTRQQPFDACVATKTRVTPAGSALDPDSGSDFLSVATEVQATSETDITKEDNANRRILSMPMILGLPPSDYGALSLPDVEAGRQSSGGRAGDHRGGRSLTQPRGDKTPVAQNGARRLENFPPTQRPARPSVDE